MHQILDKGIISACIIALFCNQEVLVAENQNFLNCTCFQDLRLVFEYWFKMHHVDQSQRGFLCSGLATQLTAHSLWIFLLCSLSWAGGSVTWLIESVLLTLLSFSTLQSWMYYCTQNRAGTQNKCTQSKLACNHGHGSVWRSVAGFCSWCHLAAALNLVLVPLPAIEPALDLRRLFDIHLFPLLSHTATATAL